MSNKFSEGACFVFNTAEEKEKNYGFIVVGIMNEAGDIPYSGNDFENDEVVIVCADVYIEKEGIVDLNDFKKGYVYTYEIYSPKGNKLGVKCTTFNNYNKEFKILNNLSIYLKLNYVGELEIDKNKFMIGRVMIADQEQSFSKTISQTEIINDDLKKTPVTNIVKD